MVFSNLKNTIWQHNRLWAFMFPKFTLLIIGIMPSHLPTMASTDALLLGSLLLGIVIKYMSWKHLTQEPWRKFPSAYYYGHLDGLLKIPYCSGQGSCPLWPQGNRGQNCFVHKGGNLSWYFTLGKEQPVPTQSVNLRFFFYYYYYFSSIFFFFLHRYNLIHFFFFCIFLVTASHN